MSSAPGPLLEADNPRGAPGDGRVNRHDAEPLRALVGELRADYPGWAISLTECHGGWRLIAYREGCPSGLYALITDDVAELRQELDNAAMARAAS